MKKLMIILFAITLFTSCMTTKTSFGSFDSKDGHTKTYSKTKQVWIFGGLIAIGRSNAKTPSTRDCQLITKYTISDILIRTITCGFVKTYTIKVKIKQ